MEIRTKANNNESTEKKAVSKRSAPIQRTRLGAAEYSKMIDLDDSSEERESENELDIPPVSGVGLNLSKRKIKKFPESLLSKMNNVQYLYLEGNRLTELPKLFFENLKSLKWLDLRNNSLTCLPTVGLKNHPSLEFILLQGNRVKKLPVELATVPTLKGLQISGNPITNVPYEAITEGFHGLIKHLQKLHAQEEILLPDSESVVFKPSTSRGNPESAFKFEVKGKPDSELGMWHVNDVCQGRQFIKKKPKAVKNSGHKYGMTRAPRDRTAMQPLSRFRKMRKTRLGYKKNPITPAMLHEKAQKDAFNAQMRETLEKQAKKIQRMRDKDVLKSWRDHSKFTRQQIKLLDNLQQYPSKDFASKIPFDIDPEFLNMLNRVDIYRSLKDYDNRHKRIKKPKTRISALDLERQMNEIMEKLKNLDTNDDGINSPRTKHKHMCDKIHKITDIQKTLKNLQTLNSTMSGIMPVVKPKPKIIHTKNK